MRVLITGSREWTDVATMCEEFCKLPDDTVIIHGGARGADTMADQMARGEHMRVEVFPADWKAHGKAAGPLRNQQMLDEGKPDLVLAFPTPKSRGTWDMVRRAKSAGVEVRVIESRR